MEISHKEAIAAQVLRFFRAYPQSSGIDAATVSDYAKAVAMYAPSFVARGVDHIINSDGPAGEVDRQYIPPIPVFLAVLRNTRASNEELDYARRMRGEPEMKRLPPISETTFDPRDRNKSTTEEVVHRFQEDCRLIDRVLHGTPIGRRLEKMRTENAHRPVLATGISLTDFYARPWPSGASYVMALETVYGRAK